MQAVGTRSGRLTGLAALLLAAGLVAARQPPPERRLALSLTRQAAAILDRYGDTFYVLAVVTDSAGEVMTVATRHWAPLSAPPAEWRDSIVAALKDEAPRVRDAAYLLDLWRPADEARQDSTTAIFHFESRDGRCVEGAMRYRERDGRTEFGDLKTSPCQRVIWRPVRG